MKLLVPIFLLFAINLQSQTSALSDTDKLVEDIIAKVENDCQCRKWQKRKYDVKEEIKKRVFTKKEICKKGKFKRYLFSKNIVERKRLNRTRFWNELNPKTGQSQIEIYIYKGDLIYVKESYLDSNSKEYFFDGGECVSVITSGIKGRIVIDDDVEYLEWFEGEIGNK